MKHRSRLGRFAAAALLLMAGLSELASATPWAFNVQDAGGHPLENAVVAVVVAGSPPTAPPGTVAEMRQRDRKFEPLVLPVQVGTAVAFPNFDTVRHHVYSFSPLHPFELKLYSGRPPSSIVFDHAGSVVLGCNIHDRMIGWIHAVPTRYFAITDRDGVAHLDLPPGTHTLVVWHPDIDGEREAPGEPLRIGAEPGTTTLQLAAPQ